MGSRLRSVALLGVLVLMTAACDWTMVGFSAGRSGFNLFENSITPTNVGALAEKWHAAAGSGSSAPVVAGGRVFVTTQPVGTTPGEVQEYDTAGLAHCDGASPALCDPGWRHAMEVVGPVSAPLVGGDRVWAGGSIDSYVTLPDGTVTEFPTTTRYGGAFTPATGDPLGDHLQGISGNGVYSDGKLYGYDSVPLIGFVPRFQVLPGLAIHDIAGSTISNELFVNVRGTPPTVAQGVIYLVTSSGDLTVRGSGPLPSGQCVPFQDGYILFVSCAPNWTVHLQAGVAWDGLVTVAKGLGYVPELNGTVEVFATTPCGLATCPVAWTAHAGSVHLGAVAVTDTTMFVSSDDGHLYAFNAAGCGAATCEPEWTASLPSGPHTPSVAGSVLFVGTNDGTLAAYNADGCGSSTCNPLWSRNVGAPITTAPAISDGHVFVTDTNGTLHAFGLT